MHGAHQLLLMKGSKGAEWSPKPILNFMIELIEKCWQIRLDGGKRSRTLVTWYEQNPNQLYPPPRPPCLPPLEIGQALRPDGRQIDRVERGL